LRYPASKSPRQAKQHHDRTDAKHIPLYTLPRENPQTTVTSVMGVPPGSKPYLSHFVGDGDGDFRVASPRNSRIGNGNVTTVTVMSETCSGFSEGHPPPRVARREAESSEASPCITAGLYQRRGSDNHVSSPSHQVDKARYVRSAQWLQEIGEPRQHGRHRQRMLDLPRQETNPRRVLDDRYLRLSLGRRPFEAL
jgi:hypothetical protein